jgi:hypothetical protein
LKFQGDGKARQPWRKTDIPGGLQCEAGMVDISAHRGVQKYPLSLCLPPESRRFRPGGGNIPFACWSGTERTARDSGHSTAGKWLTAGSLDSVTGQAVRGESRRLAASTRAPRWRGSRAGTTSLWLRRGSANGSGLLSRATQHASLRRSGSGRRLRAAAGRKRVAVGTGTMISFGIEVFR